MGRSAAWTVTCRMVVPGRDRSAPSAVVVKVCRAAVSPFLKASKTLNSFTDCSMDVVWDAGRLVGEPGTATLEALAGGGSVVRLGRETRLSSIDNRARDCSDGLELRVTSCLLDTRDRRDLALEAFEVFDELGGG